MERMRPWTRATTDEREALHGIETLLLTVAEGLPALTSYDARVRAGERLLRLARETLPPDSWRFEHDPLLRSE